MDKGQIRTMQLFGYSVEEIPGRTIPKVTYYKEENGQIVELANLPADPYHMQRYLKRGFVLKRPPQPEPQKVSSDELVSEACGEACGEVLFQPMSHKKTRR